MKQLFMYDLPNVLFENYLKELQITTIKEVDLTCFEDKLIRCKYAELPEQTKDEKPALLLIDTRGFSGISEGAQSTKLVVCTSIPNPKRHVGEIFGVGSIHAWCTSHSDSGRSGCRYWLSAAAETASCGINFSFCFSKLSNMHFFELAKRAQGMYVDPQYPWINSYFKNLNEVIPIEIQGKEIMEVSKLNRQPF